MKKTLVFIMSSNYSGSHYLSQLLGSNSKAIHVGEVKNVIKQNHECYICGDTDNCSLFGGLGGLPKEEIYPTLFDRAPEGTRILVDNSKKVGWVQQFLFLKKIYNIKIIYLLRDPRALSRRWAIRDINALQHFRVRYKSAKRFPSQSLPILFGDPVNAYIYRWLEQNQRISNFIESAGVETIVTTYQELASDTSKALAKLTNFIGAKFEKEQIEYWNFDHHGTQKDQYEWVKKQGISAHIDLRWKEFLTEKQHRLIKNSAPLHEFFHRMHVEMHDDGLYLTT
ncbi:MAG: hypothetical protein COB22_00090 [Cycloclasticus sp.]|nr:MAG: hypothetical protein COB22_00090 [Cycloclasticus sp.]